MNEANSNPYKIFWQLQRKTRRKVILDFNPSNRFWVHEKVLPGTGQEKQFAGRVQRFIVDHRHNPFLSQEDHDSYENINDPDLFRVYSRGLTGEVKGLIYNWRKVASIPNDCERIIWGIDYGYTNDPTAIVKTGVRGRQRFIKCVAYSPGISSRDIANILTIKGWDPDQPLYSEHDIHMITQIKRAGISTVYPERK